MVSVSPEEAALSSDSPTIHDFQISYDFKYIFENHQCVVSQIKTILKQLWDQVKTLNSIFSKLKFHSSKIANKNFQKNQSKRSKN